MSQRLAYCRTCSKRLSLRLVEPEEALRRGRHEAAYSEQADAAGVVQYYCKSCTAQLWKEYDA